MQVKAPTAVAPVVVFRKTAKGQAEFDSAARALPQKLRTVLVLIDGKRSAQDLLALLPSATPQALTDLHTLGLIETVPGVATRRKEPAPNRTDAGPASRLPSRLDSRHDSRLDSRMPSRFDVATSPEDEAATDHQREQIERSLKRALGPAADGLVHSIRDARTVRDLMDVLSTAQRAIANARGQDMADEFASRYGNIDEL